jgi:hypothetical protein
VYPPGDESLGVEVRFRRLAILLSEACILSGGGSVIFSVFIGTPSGSDDERECRAGNSGLYPSSELVEGIRALWGGV